MKRRPQPYAPDKGFRWTKKRERAALMLADGITRKKVVEELGIGLRTIYRWLDHPEFDAEVDRLTLMTGIAAKAERLRIAKRAIRQDVSEAGVKTKRDVLDWIKFAQSETDGIKLDLTPLFEDALALAGGGSGGDEPANDSAGDGTEPDA